MTTDPSDAARAALRDAGVADWLVEAVDRLARREGRSLDGYLDTVGDAMALDDTRATCRCHYIAVDGAGRPRVKPLVELLAEQVVDYCIPRTRILEAQAELEATASTEKMVRLMREADGLFTKLKTSGEGGEMLLYLLLEVGLGLPQLLCKMPLKTAANMHVHGTDGIHGRVLDDGTLALYWCESKLYASVNDAVDECLDSIAPFLLDPDGEEAKRDVLLLRDQVDLGDPALSEALRRYFTAGAPEARRVEVRGAGLVGFSMADYPSPFETDRITVTEAATTKIEQWYDRIGSKVGDHKLAGVEMELFCVPFPDVQEFRDELRSRLGLG